MRYIGAARTYVSTGNNEDRKKTLKNELLNSFRADRLLFARRERIVLCPSCWGEVNLDILLCPHCGAEFETFSDASISSRHEKRSRNDGLLRIVAIIAISGVLCGYTPVGVSIGLIALPFFSVLLGDPLPIVIGYIVMLVLVIVRRLAVRRSAIAGSISTGELMLNRLFYDRDIADREAWLNRQSVNSANEVEDER